MSNIYIPKTKAIFPILHKEVDIFCRSFGPIIPLSPSEEKIVHQERALVRQALIDWLCPWIDLSSYDGFYSCYGVTGAINDWLLLERRPIQMFVGDYSWLSQVRPDIRLVNSVKDLRQDHVLYISNPSSIDGCFRSDWIEIVESGCRIILDCVYLGTCSQQQIKLNSNVEQIFWSLSKSHGLSSYRAGWRFSFEKIDAFEELNQFDYFRRALDIFTIELLSAFSSSYFYNKLRSVQESICLTSRLNISDSFLIAWARSNESLAFFERSSGNVQRISIAPNIWKLFPEHFGCKMSFDNFESIALSH